MVFLSISYPLRITLRVCQNYFLLSKYNVILNVSEGSLYKYERFFLPDGRQNDKMIVDFSFALEQQSRGRNSTTCYIFQILPGHYTLSLFPKEGRATKSRREIKKNNALYFPTPSPFRVLPLCKRGRVF